MTTSDEKTNPLYGLQIGSCVRETGKFMIPTVINGSITRTIVQSQEWRSMSGSSNYVYTKEMNQGSVGVSGSYGWSGLYKMDTAVSGYVGHSSATGGKSVTLNYQVKVLGGIQHIDFDNLTPDTLSAALADTPRQKLEKALEKYNALHAALERLETSGKTLLDVLGARTTYPDESGLYDEWAAAVTDFNSRYGDGLVIAVAWGGVGTVTMDISAKSDGSSWKYGGEAAFSFAAAAGSVAVSAAYDGNQSKGKADVDVKCNAFASGSCVNTQVDAWLNEVNGKAFSALADVDVLAQAPDMTIAAKPLKVPDFVKPKPEPGSTFASKLGEIKDLKGLKAYAQASAYDKAVNAAKKNKQDPPSLSEFLQKAGDPAYVKQLEEMCKKVAANNINAADDDNDNVPVARAFMRAQPMLAPTPVVNDDDVFSGYVPLGVWIANWAHLFPWLATGYLNSIDDTQAPDSSIRSRVLIQDFLALSRLYYIADNCGFSFPNVSKIDFKKIADSFAASCATLQQGLADLMEQNHVILPSDYETKMQSARGSLSQDAMKIYKTWNEYDFLRSCELGLAVMGDYGVYGQSPKIPVSPNSSGSGFTAAGSKCNFDVQKRTPYSEFADCYKLLPLILPDGTIFAIGPGKSLLVDYDNYASLKFTFSNGPDGDPMEFTANAASMTLDSKSSTGDQPWYEALVRLFPVPFSAANGIEWQGQGFSTNVAADSNLISQLNQIKADLQDLPAWSFSSEAWDSAWTGDDGYSMSLIRKQYVGLVSTLADKLG